MRVPGFTIWHLGGTSHAQSYGGRGAATATVAKAKVPAAKEEIATASKFPPTLPPYRERLDRKKSSDELGLGEPWPKLSARRLSAAPAALARAPAKKQRVDGG